MLNTGVYCITNKINGKRYIGSAAISFSNRWNRHLVALRNGNHHSNSLQQAWHKHGRSAFVFNVLHRCKPKYCLAMEQFFIDRLNTADSRYGYNIRPKVGFCSGRPRLESLLGKKFNKLTVLELREPGHSYLCQCDCGNLLTVKAHSIYSGHTTSCGCYNRQRLKEVHTGKSYCRGKIPHNKLDRSGKKYGLLTVIKDLGNGRWQCKCACGKIMPVLSTNLSNYRKNNRGCRSCMIYRKRS